MSAPPGASSGGPGAHPSSAAMTMGPSLPIEDGSVTTHDISTPVATPPNSGRSRSVRGPQTLPPLPVAPMPQTLGFSHRGQLPKAAREGGPRVSQTNVLNQYTRVENPEAHYHDQRQVYLTQQNLMVNTHDPAITSLVESEADRRHHEVLKNVEMQADLRHEVRTSELKEALRVREAEEQQRALDLLHRNQRVHQEENQSMKELIQQEANEHLKYEQNAMQMKVEGYKRVLDVNMR